MAIENKYIPEAPPLPCFSFTEKPVIPTITQIERRADQICEADATELKLLHDHPEYFDEALCLLDQEWRHSHRSQLLASSDKLPLSVVLISVASKIVVAHASLAHVVGEARDHVYISSVVVLHQERGRGFGRRLMDSVHRFCRDQLGKRVAHLCTLDQVGFYQALGYEKSSSPVTPLRFAAQEKLASLMPFRAIVHEQHIQTWMQKNLSDDS